MHSIVLHCHTKDNVLLENNLFFGSSFETVNCSCCKNKQEALVPPEVMDEINRGLEKLKTKETRTKPYWICQRREGAFVRICK